MMSLNKIDGVLELPIKAAVVETTADGKESVVSPEVCAYLSSRVANRVKAKYEDWLEGRARRRVFKFKQEMQPHEYQESMDAVARQSAAGTFEWSGDAWEVSLKQFPGIVKLIQLLADEADLRFQDDKKQKLTEETIYGWIQDEGTREMLVSAIREVISASPNFRSPPIRERGD